MHPIAKNVLAVIAGVVVGSVVNMGLINLGPILIPLPEGADMSTPESLRESMKLFTPANWLVPFLAHALGTFVGALVAAKVAASHPLIFAMGIAAFFLLGGITMVYMVGGPLWFILSDLLLAYLPMGYLGGILGRGRSPTAEQEAG